MAAFLSDTFTETVNIELSARSPETGGAWAKWDAATFPKDLIIDAATDWVRASLGAGVGLYINDAAPPSANHHMEGVLQWATNDDGTQRPGLMVRALNGTLTCYYVRYLGHATAGSRGWQLVKFLNGSESAIGFFAANLAVDTDHTVRLTANGTTISVDVDSTEVISVTDADVTATGFVGVISLENGRISSVTADVVSAGGGGESPRNRTALHAIETGAVGRQVGLHPISSGVIGG